MLDYGGTQAGFRPIFIHSFKLVFVILYFLFFCYFFVWLRPRNPPGLIKAVKSLSFFLSYFVLIIIIIEGLSLLQSIPPTTANKQTQAQKNRGSMARKLLGERERERFYSLNQTRRVSRAEPNKKIKIK